MNAPPLPRSCGNASNEDVAALEKLHAYLPDESDLGVRVERTVQGKTVEVFDDLGAMRVRVVIDGSHTTVEVAADRLKVAAPEVDLSCERFALRASGRAKIHAKSLELAADAGDVRIEASSDVRANGRNIYLNC